MKTPLEILQELVLNDFPLLAACSDEIIKAMDDYGRQSFEAGREYLGDGYIYTHFEDYQRIGTHEL